MLWGMPGVSDRLRRRIKRDFPAPGSAASVTEMVASASESERIQAAVVICARGQVDRLRDACELAEQDWRDVLAGAGLADEDWRSRLETELGPAGLGSFAPHRRTRMSQS
jgi:hypothetical protein